MKLIGLKVKVHRDLHALGNITHQFHQLALPQVSVGVVKVRCWILQSTFLNGSHFGWQSGENQCKKLRSDEKSEIGK